MFIGIQLNISTHMFAPYHPALYDITNMTL